MCKGGFITLPSLREKLFKFQEEKKKCDRKKLYPIFLEETNLRFLKDGYSFKLQCKTCVEIIISIQGRFIHFIVWRADQEIKLFFQSGFSFTTIHES